MDRQVYSLFIKHLMLVTMPHQLKYLLTDIRCQCQVTAKLLDKWLGFLADLTLTLR